MIITLPSNGSGTGTRFILASQIAGINLNSNVETGGGTNDTATLQTVLNTASVSSPLMLIMDGAALVSQLVVKSYTVIQCLTSSCGFYKISNSGTSIVRNATPSRTTRTDTDICFIGGTYNGNGANQPHHDTVSGTWSVGIGLYGVNRLSLNGVRTKNVTTFAIHIVNWGTATLRDVECYGGSGLINTDGVHFNGPGTVARVDNLRCFALADDSLAFNADDLLDGPNVPGQTGPDALGPWVGEGDIDDITVDGLYLEGCLFGLRGLAAHSRIKKMTVRNISGTLSGSIGGYHHAVILDHHIFADGGGGFGQVTLEDIDVGGLVPLNDGLDESLIEVSQRIDHLTIRGLRRNNFLGNTPTIRVRPGTAIRVLELTGFAVGDYQTTEPALTQHLRIEGSVTTLIASEWVWSRKTEFTQKTPQDLLYIAAGGSVGARLGNVFPSSAFDAALQPPLSASFTANGVLRIVLDRDYQINSVLSSGTGTLALSKSSGGGAFGTVSPPFVGVLGDALELTASGVSGTYGATLTRQALTQLPFEDLFERSSLGANYTVYQGTAGVNGSALVATSEGVSLLKLIKSGTTMVPDARQYTISMLCRKGAAINWNVSADNTQRYLWQWQSNGNIDAYDQTGPSSYTAVTTPGLVVDTSSAAKILSVVLRGTSAQLWFDGIQRWTGTLNYMAGRSFGIQLIGESPLVGTVESLSITIAP